jgi:hypothetical protein
VHRQPPVTGPRLHVVEKAVRERRARGLRRSRGHRRGSRRPSRGPRTPQPSPRWPAPPRSAPARPANRLQPAHASPPAGRPPQRASRSYRPAVFQSPTRLAGPPTATHAEPAAGGQIWLGTAEYPICGATCRAAQRAGMFAGRGETTFLWRPHPYRQLWARPRLGTCPRTRGRARSSVAAEVPVQAARDREQRHVGPPHLTRQNRLGGLAHSPGTPNAPRK